MIVFKPSGPIFETRILPPEGAPAVIPWRESGRFWSARRQERKPLHATNYNQRGSFLNELDFFPTNTGDDFKSTHDSKKENTLIFQTYNIDLNFDVRSTDQIVTPVYFSLASPIHHSDPPGQGRARTRPHPGGCEPGEAIQGFKMVFHLHISISMSTVLSLIQRDDTI